MTLHAARQVSLLVLGHLAVTTSAQTTAPTSKPAVPVCYTGPIEFRVLNPDGTPAPNVAVGVFGETWAALDGETVAKRFEDNRTDEQGRFARESIRECCDPTFYYAFDEERSLAGFCIIEQLDNLAEPHVVHLQPARWVTGRIISNEMKRTGKHPRLIGATLSPFMEFKRRSRILRYVTTGSDRFRFLVPPGEYSLYVQGSRLERRVDINVRVPKGDSPIDLGTFDLELTQLARMQGKPAPAWDVAEWSDGKRHELADYRGRPVVLGFWHKYSAPRNATQAVFALHERLRGTNVTMLLIHVPEVGGLTGLNRALVDLRESGALPPQIEPNVQRWPFPVGIDRPATPPLHTCSGLEIGASEQPYGILACPTFVLMDAKGIVVADSDMDEKEWEAALLRLAK